jgi:hypothetical protein
MTARLISISAATISVQTNTVPDGEGIRQTRGNSNSAPNIQLRLQENRIDIQELTHSPLTGRNLGMDIFAGHINASLSHYNP